MAEWRLLVLGICLCILSWTGYPAKSATTAAPNSHIRIGLINNGRNICRNLPPSYKKLYGSVNVTAEIVFLSPPPPIKSKRQILDTAETYQREKISAIIYDFDPNLALISSILNVPYLAFPTVSEGLQRPPKTLLWANSLEFGLPTATANLIGGLKPLEQLVIISNNNFKDMWIYSRAFEQLMISMSYIDYPSGANETVMRAKFLGLNLPYSEDVGFVILLENSEINALQTIMMAGLYSGHMNTRQLWLIPNFNVTIDLLRPFAFTWSRIITFDRPLSLTATEVQEALCQDLLIHLMKSTQVSGKKSFLEKIKETVTYGPKMGRLAFAKNTRLENDLIIKAVFRGQSDAFVKIGKWVSKTKSVDVKNRYFTLKPLPVKIGVVDQRPLFSFSVSGQPVGFFYAFLTEIATQLRWQVEWVVGSELGSLLSNDTWSGLIGKMQRKEIDVLADLLVPVPERRKVMTFTPPFLVAGYTWLAQKEPKTIVWTLYLQPFTFWVWVGVIICFILGWLTYFVIEVITRKTLRTPNDVDVQNNQKIAFVDRLRLNDAFMVVFADYVMTKLAIKPRMFSSRLIILLLSFVSLITVLSYAAYLTAIIYKPETMESAKGDFDDLLDNAHKYTWFWSTGDTIYSRMEAAENGSLSYRLAVMARENWPKSMFVPRNETMNALMADWHRVYISEYVFAAYNSAVNCSLESGHEILLSSEKTIAYRQDFEDRQLLDETILRMKNKIGHLFIEWTSYPDMCSKKEYLDETIVAPVFVLLAAGILLGLLTVLIELCIKETKILRIRLKLPKLRFGNLYVAHTNEVNDEGIWMTVGERPNKYYLPSSQLHSEPIKRHTPSDLGIEVGSTFKVRYFGKDPITKAKRFVRETSM